MIHNKDGTITTTEKELMEILSDAFDKVKEKGRYELAQEWKKHKTISEEDKKIIKEIDEQHEEKEKKRQYVFDAEEIEPLLKEIDDYLKRHPKK